MSNLELADQALGGRVTYLDVSDQPWGKADLLTLLPADQPTWVWLHQDRQMVGWGEAARLEVRGPERFSRAQRWLAQFDKSLVEVTETFGHPTNPAGRADPTGLIAFASFAFDPHQASSVIVVPNVTLTRRDGRTFLLLVDDGVVELAQPAQRAAHLARAIAAQVQQDASSKTLTVAWQADEEAKREWSQKVGQAVRRINAGELDKVVLARAISATANQPIDPQWCLRRLRRLYPTCWVFKVDDLLGATPELLVARDKNQIFSQVLAGTIHPQDGRGFGAENLKSKRAGLGSARESGANARLAEILLESAKDLAEHQYAVSSVATALANHCTDLQVPKRPSVLALGNVSHLATSISGQLADDASALILAASLHPTAAVCGTPTERASALITEVEDLNRGRYAGPVGWVSANGNGEFGIALRCGKLEGDEITAFAGCGLVAGSEPEQEWQESEAKLGAIKGMFTN